jgi:hypothetical protein
MIPCVDNNVLDCLTPNTVPLKPEAPWIKRCSFGIKFTDEIYMTDDDRENTPDEEKEYKKRKTKHLRHSDRLEWLGAQSLEAKPPQGNDLGRTDQCSSQKQKGAVDHGRRWLA